MDLLGILFNGRSCCDLIQGGSVLQGGVRGLGDLPSSDESEGEDGEKGNELYTGGAKR